MSTAWLAAALTLCSLSSAAAADIAPERIIDAAIGDWNGDTLPDLALLVGPPEAGDSIGIYLYVRQADHALLKLVTAAPEKVSGTAELDGFFGQEPSITALTNGSISVQSQNSGIGRNRWEQTLTLAMRNGDFVVAGYTYSFYDTLDPDSNGRCDYNVLTGKIKKDDKPLRVAPNFVTIEAWTDEVGQTACRLQ